MNVLNIVLVILLATPAVAKPRIAEATILGDWCAGSDTAFHEEFSLEIEDGVRMFSSWLHQRPAESGTWELRDRTLTIHGRSGQDYVYKIVSASRKRLVVRSGKEPREVYLREGCRKFEDPYVEELNQQDNSSQP